MPRQDIPILDLNPEIKLLRDELNAAYHRVMDHGQFIMGPEVKSFEKDAAEFLGTKHAIGVNSGTDALVIALKAAGVGKDDEVITTSFTFFATAESIEMAGAKPVFVDIEEGTFNINPEEIERAITGKTKAIMPVHLYGRPAEMNKISELAEKHNLKVIEDCAQSFGATYKGKQTGTIGHAGAYSFFPSKNLGGFGDAGLIATDDDEIAEMSLKLRAHGSIKKYHNEVMGYNSRLDTLQAALLQVKLKHVDQFNENRREIAHRYIKAFEGLEHIAAPALPDEGHVYHQFTIRVKNGLRDALAEKLGKEGIGTMIYYPVPCHKLPVYEGRFDNLQLPVCNRLTEEVLSLPISPFLSEKSQHFVIEAIKSGSPVGVTP
ncbi:MAG: DegT/DnrJ/EryC1/StrS family aminotransferase [Balneolaceae bacterium]